MFWQDAAIHREPAMPDWSIKIVKARKPTKNAPAAFQPDLAGSKPGDPLKVQDDDIVSWNNTTGDAHWPWQTDSNYVPFPDDKVKNDPTLNLSNSILSGRSSNPAYNVLLPNANASPPPQSGTIYYCCKYHPKERGTIFVAAIPS
jgi:hypothetical protein